ncbi:MAG TPA: non-canonical purine NTP pyrophosphatase [Ktedonobacterales bacterium]
MPLVFATTNFGKLQEVRAMLPFEVTHLPIHLPEIQALDVDEVVRAKAEWGYEHVGVPVLVEDTGLAFTAWNGLPGALIRWFMESVGSKGLCRMLSGEDDRGAVAKCVFDLFDGHEHRLFSGLVQGTIALAPRGQNGFGWYDILIPNGHTVTFAEMPVGQRHTLTMRKLAVDQLRMFLESSNLNEQ